MELFSILALFAGIYLAVRCSNFLTHWLRDTMQVKSEYLPIIVFILIFVLVLVGLWLLGKKISENVNEASGEKLNKAGGSIFCLSRMVLFLSIIFILLNAVDERYNILPKEQKTNSLLFAPIYKFSMAILPVVENSEFYRKLKEKGLDDAILNTEPKETASNE